VAVNDKDPIGRTPLHIAALVGSTEIAKLLVENKVNSEISEFFPIF
jgi:ankyrin repeat protein